MDSCNLSIIESRAFSSLTWLVWPLFVGYACGKFKGKLYNILMELIAIICLGTDCWWIFGSIAETPYDDIIVGSILNVLKDDFYYDMIYFHNKYMLELEKNGWGWPGNNTNMEHKYWDLAHKCKISNANFLSNNTDDTESIIMENLNSDNNNVIQNLLSLDVNEKNKINNEVLKLISKQDKDEMISILRMLGYDIICSMKNAPLYKYATPETIE